MATITSRKQLYAQVWQQPLTHIARDLGISDVGLRKVCKRHAIPTPPAGHWAKLAHGKPVTVAKLPDPDDDRPITIWKGGGGDEPVPPELEPVHEIHMSRVEEAEKEYGGYKEQGEPQVLEVSLGPARRSEFTAATTFGSGLHGYRATILGHDRDLTVYCICPETDWKALQPAFDHLLGSLKRGHAE